MNPEAFTTKKFRISFTITTVDGQTHQSDSDVVPESKLNEVEEYISDFSDLTNLNIRVGGVKVFFNVANVVTISLNRTEVF